MTREPLYIHFIVSLHHQKTTNPRNLHYAQVTTSRVSTPITTTTTTKTIQTSSNPPISASQSSTSRRASRAGATCILNFLSHPFILFDSLSERCKPVIVPYISNTIRSASCIHPHSLVSFILFHLFIHILTSISFNIQPRSRERKILGSHQSPRSIKVSNPSFPTRLLRIDSNQH